MTTVKHYYFANTLFRDINDLERFQLSRGVLKSHICGVSRNIQSRSKYALNRLSP